MIQSYQVLVHSPYDFPEVGGKGFAIGNGNVAYIGVGATFTGRCVEMYLLKIVVHAQVTVTKATNM